MFAINDNGFVNQPGHSFTTRLVQQGGDLFREAIRVVVKELRQSAVFDVGQKLEGLFVVERGRVDIRGVDDAVVSLLGEGDVFGGRGLMRDGLAVTRAVAVEPLDLLVLPRASFDRLVRENAAFARCFERPPQAFRRGTATDGDLTTLRIGDIMTRDPVAVRPDTTVAQAARRLRDEDISCVLVTGEGGALRGILTTGDLAARVLAEGRGGDAPVEAVMTPDPFTLAPDAIGFDAFLAMTERRIGHLPVVEDGVAVGIVTRTNLVRRRTVSAVSMIGDIARQDSLPAIRGTVAQIPMLLAQLVGAGVDPPTVARLITGIADAVTRRLLALAQEELGPAPVPWLWAACGSQGRVEQTGVSDQDNCLLLDDAYDEAAHGTYFAGLAKRVSDGLDACGYYHCPGEMMATNPRWRQKLAVWRGYFAGWVRTPDPMAQMLASVMFDLRPIAGTFSLLSSLQEETLAMARANSIFVAHMIANSLKHQPPLGFFRGMALIRSGEHKDTIDLKLSGVVPIVDLARVYALQGAIPLVNTRARLEAARSAGVISPSGAHDLIDAYDLICETRLRHQARQARDGRRIDNFMAPRELSELERNHLRDAFVVVKTMQAALGQGRQMMG